jgi:hypothetical protein
MSARAFMRLWSLAVKPDTTAADAAARNVPDVTTGAAGMLSTTSSTGEGIGSPVVAVTDAVGRAEIVTGPPIFTAYDEPVAVETSAARAGGPMGTSSKPTTAAISTPVGPRLTGHPPRSSRAGAGASAVRGTTGPFLPTRHSTTFLTY